MQGETYVTVEADASTPNLMAEGSTIGYGIYEYKVRWSTPNGITGISWPNGMSNDSVKGLTPQQINSQITENFSGWEIGKLAAWNIAGCMNKK